DPAPIAERQVRAALLVRRGEREMKPGMSRQKGAEVSACVSAGAENADRNRMHDECILLQCLRVNGSMPARTARYDSGESSNLHGQQARATTRDTRVDPHSGDRQPGGAAAGAAAPWMGCHAIHALARHEGAAARPNPD